MIANNGRQPRQVELELDLEESTIALPSPKRVASTTLARKHLPWEGNYAAYSIQFATEAVRQLGDQSGTHVFDPFSGNGTTLEAASRLGIDATGIELNPYSALLSRCRVALSADRAAVKKLLRDTAKRTAVRQSTHDGLNGAVPSLLERISAKAGHSSEAIVAALCKEGAGLVDSEVVALVALLYVKRMRAHFHFRSNPAWLVAGDDPAKVRAAPSESWLSEAIIIADSMLEDLALRATLRRPRYSVCVEDFRRVALGAGAIRRFLTSPPYLNRLDYVNPTLPALSELGFHEAKDIEDLRVRMMGTSKMRPAQSFTPFMSPVANDFLLRVSKHSSKASATYYRRFFWQYFSDLDEFLTWLSRAAAHDVFGMLVLQDSYYKEIRVPLSEIMIELAGARGFQVRIIKSEPRSRHMGRISPHQRAYAPVKVLTEYVLSFQKGGAAPKLAV